jgi:hypothetical protein
MHKVRIVPNDIADNEPSSNHFKECLNVLLRCNDMCPVRLVNIRYDNCRPAKLEELFKGSEESTPRLIPPGHIMDLKMTDVCRIHLGDALT